MAYRREDGTIQTPNSNSLLSLSNGKVVPPIIHHSSFIKGNVRPRISFREWLVASSGGLTLAFTAWGLGGIPAWSLHVLLAGGLATLTLALCPLPGKAQKPDSVAERETRFDPNADSVAERETRFDPNADFVAERETRFDPNADSVAERETRFDLNADSVAERETRFDPNADSVAERETRFDLNADSVAERETRFDPNADSVAERETRFDLNTAFVAERETRFDPNAAFVAERETRFDLNADSVAERETRFDLNADSVAERGTRFDLLHVPLQSLKRLVRWPFFYFSLAFLLYLLIGALNPAAQIVSDERGWWVEAIQPRFAAWLPTSVLSDYQPMNAWRVLAVFTASFSLVWGLWAGLTRRAPVLLVLWCLLLSGAGMGLVGILQHLSEAKAVLWTFPSSNRYFWGSFFYRNQGAAYLNLILVLAGFLFFYHGVKTREKLRSGGPHFLCFLLFALTAASVGLALSRGGILFAGIISLAFIVLLAVFLFQGLWHISSIWTALIPLVLLASAGFLAIRYIDLDAIEQRFGDIEKAIETADQDARAVSTKATWDMAQDRLALGWGAGSFRYIFPMYQRNYPQLFYGRYDKRKQDWVGRKVYRYAHNDILQFLAEYGAIGCGLLLLALGSVIFSILKSAFHFPLATFHLMVGFATIIAHAFLDFIFNSPAYWMAFVALLVVASKLLQLEQARRLGRSR